MKMLFRSVFVLFYLQVADFTEPPCIIDVECAECVPDNPPLVTSHSAADGAVRVPAGARVTLACAGGRFLLYPLRDSLAADCERGRFRVRADGALRHVLDLGCQENVFEDVLHEVEHCGAPLQGRAYRLQAGPAGAAGAGGGGARHLAAACFDADRALPGVLHTGGAPPPPHRDRAGPLSLLGNFNHMFDAKTRHDAELLYSDDVRLNRRLRELFKHDHYTFAEQTLTSAKLLSDKYFDDQHARVTDFASNKVASWSSVVRGNLQHIQRDVSEYMRRARAAPPPRDLDLYTGTHGVLSLNADVPTEVYLKAGKRFPVPKYIWTVLHAKSENKGLAVILLNDPLVTVSEIREAVFCESACGAVSWLPRLLRNRNFERPVAGLAFCCRLPEFAARVAEMPNVFNATVAPLF